MCVREQNIAAKITQNNFPNHSSNKLENLPAGRALTHARRMLNDLSHSRICAGGRTGDSSGRYSPILAEEQGSSTLVIS
jgi:hypothetical protein